MSYLILEGAVKIQLRPRQNEILCGALKVNIYILNASQCEPSTHCYMHIGQKYGSMTTNKRFLVNYKW